MSEISHWLTTFLLNAAWQITAMTAVAMLCVKLLHRMPSRYAHAFWACALAGCLLIPSVTMVIQARTAGAAHAGDPGGLGSALDDSQSRTTPKLPVSFRSISRSVSVSPMLIRVLLWPYGVLLLFRVTQLAWAARQTWRVRQSAYARPLPACRFQVAERCLRSFSLPLVPVLCSAEVSGPATVGIRRPLLILPESFFTDAVSEDDVFSAFCHELAHIRRRDFLFNLLYEAALVPVCFHPGAWLIKARIAQTRELACDEAAAPMLPSPGRYARSLLRIAQAVFSEIESDSSYALGLFDTNTLEERVMNILKTRKASRTWARASRLVAACLVGIVSLGISAFSLRLTAFNGSEDLARFAGTWETKYKGQAFFTLKLEAANGTLAGTCVHVTRVAVLADGELIPGTEETTTDQILEVRSYGEKLLLKIADGDNSHGIELEFTLTAKDQGDGIVFVRPSSDGPPPPKKPWHFQRVSRNP
jgi:beta-lactamase regulating signal transducer with metallopeptidase domain